MVRAHLNQRQQLKPEQIKTTKQQKGVEAGDKPQKEGDVKLLSVFSIKSGTVQCSTLHYSPNLVHTAQLSSGLAGIGASPPTGLFLAGPAMLSPQKHSTTWSTTRHSFQTCQINITSVTIVIAATIE